MKIGLLFRVCVTTFCVFLFFAFLCYAQESEEEDKAIDLPPVKIEIVDATQLNIPKENFQGLTKPDYDIYVALSHKERLWYLPSTAIPKKFRDQSVKPQKDFLVVLSAYPGLPTALSYQALLMKGFGNSQVLIDIGRSSLLSGRVAKLASDHTKKQSGSTIDQFKGLFSYQTETSDLRTGLDYSAKNLDYLDINGIKYPNDRSLFNLSMSWDQRLPNGVEPSINAEIGKLIMEGPLSSDSNDALNIRADASVRAFLSPSLPIEAGVKIENFSGNGVNEDFKETIVKLYFRDKHIRLWPFVLSVGLELATDVHKSSITKDGWETSFSPNPYILLTSQLGSKTVLQFGLERYILKQDIEETYIKSGYMMLNPSLDTEKVWDIYGLLKLNLTKMFTATAGYFDKEISDLAVPIESQNTDGTSGSRIMYWSPENLDSTHISGINAGWELLLLDDRLKQSIEYVHEFHGE
jgi:hypothetical protein